jgi:hypothetical protein
LVEQIVGLTREEDYANQTINRNGEEVYLYTEYADYWAERVYWAFKGRFWQGWKRVFQFMGRL